MTELWTTVARLGQAGLQALAWLGGLLVFAVESLGTGWKYPGFLNSVCQQTVMIYRRCFLPVVFMLLPLGAMLALQGLLVVKAFDLNRLFSGQILNALVREMAPGFAALMVAMQAGAGLTAELGTMTVRQENLALKTMGLDPVGYLGAPRVIAVVLATLLLCPVGIIAGVCGAFTYAVVIKGFPIQQFVFHMSDLIHFSDLWLAEFKCLVFGCLTGILCVDAGLQPRIRSAADVGKAANKAVVRCVVLLVVSNYLLNTALYGLRG